MNAPTLDEHAPRPLPDDPERVQRRRAAVLYRLQIANNLAREDEWTHYRRGAEWYGQDWRTGANRVATILGNDDAERFVPFPPLPSNVARITRR